eukprot:CAMPEP_0170547748 /NCGR_PEP_ID=MMETSP0211-20121228/6092_1 /TAXON_ID=311385 /ORGANISM="Pseudokeronopsis sp., Strain OXSARD2" /LENGTH=197 /DNA_ID=CAMNT_0010852913 /DNA_START=177 /DNA_END=770 /DNA_ORIENTATION=-
MLAFIYQLNIIGSEPLDPLSHLPQAMLPSNILDSFTSSKVNAQSLLLAIVPPSLEVPPIFPNEEPIPLFLLIIELSFVYLSFSEPMLSQSMHLVVVPMANVPSAVLPSVLAETMDAISEPLSLVMAAILDPIELSKALLVSFKEAPFVFRAIKPSFFSLAMLPVEFPVASVGRAHGVDVNPIAMGHRHVELSLIDVP